METIVIYKEFGALRATTKENHEARITDARKIWKFDGFDTASEVSEYLDKYFPPHTTIVDASATA